MTLVATRTAGWAAGFRNLLRKEVREWWQTRRWLVHLLLWLVVIDGSILAVTIQHRLQGALEQGLTEGAQVLFQLGGFFTLIGAVLITQGAIVGERRAGTAAWVLTKPTTRAAFILAKLLAITSSYLLLSLVIPSVAALIIFHIVLGMAPAALDLLNAGAVIALHQAFYIALTLMLGTMFNERGPVAGTAIGFWIAGQMLPRVLPAWVVKLTPWPLAMIAESIALDKPAPAWFATPLAATAVLSVAWTIIALWRFEREEL